MIRLFLFFAFLFSSAFAAHKKPAQVKTDSGKVNVRSFDNQALSKYKTEKEFNYNEKADVSPSLWDRFWTWFWNYINDIFKEHTPSGTFFKYLFIILGVAALGFAVFKLAGMDAGLLFTGKSKDVEVPYEETLENIHEIAFDDEIQKALLNNNFRVAVRMQYLKCLKKLNDSGKIRWEPGKTNSAYVNEIANERQRELFAGLTRRFEYVWYGDFPVDRTGFTAISDLFLQFYRSN